MKSDELKSLIDEWHEALRRYNYLQALREALPSGPTAHALEQQLARAKTELDRLQQAVLDGSGP